jgi:hypothetical protein
VTIEQVIFDAIKSVFGNRVYPDVGPEGGSVPYATFQQVGGQTLSFLEGGAAPSKRNVRMQVNVWAATRSAAAALAVQVEDALRLSTLCQAEPLGEPIARYEDEGLEVPLYGTTQDFSLWFDRSM